jgi:pimeloyl-ACP methyl ester carboxylesterase
MPTLTLDGVPLHYEERGRGLPVLLFHAFPLTGDLFQPQVEALSDRYRFIVPDLRGFGRSGLGQGPTEMSLLARDGLALLDALGVPSAVVGGVSMGGYAAMALVREDPGRVKGLLLMDTQAGADDDAGKHKREENAQTVLRQGMQFMVDTMIPRLVAPWAPASVKAKVEEMIRRNTPEATAAALRGMALRSDSKDILARFGGPTLVLVGDQDAITPLEKAQQMADLVSGSRLAQIPGAAHLANLENPGAVNRELDAFLASIPA